MGSAQSIQSARPPRTHLSPSFTASHAAPLRYARSAHHHPSPLAVPLLIKSTSLIEHPGSCSNRSSGSACLSVAATWR